MTYNLVNYTSVSRIVVFVVSHCLIPPEYNKEYFYFHGNVIISISSIRIYQIGFITKALTGTPWMREECTDSDQKALRR